MDEERLTWKEKVIIRILLIIARMMADATWAEEIKHLSNHIAVGG